MDANDLKSTLVQIMAHQQAIIWATVDQYLLLTYGITKV